MTFVDRTGQAGGLLWVALGVGFQLAWFLRRSVVPGPVTLVLGTLVVLLAAAIVSRSPRACWLAGRALSVSLALDLGGAVADRFGAWGLPGAPGVSWGSWPGFVDYTAQLLPGLDRGVVVAAAVAATATEITLGVLLLSGWRRRWVGRATAGLLAVYLVAMALTVGADAVATFGLPVLVGGALLVSSAPVHRPTRRRRARVLVRSGSGFGSRVAP